MPEIIEYITQKGGSGYGQYFTPNNAGVSVPIIDRGSLVECDNVNFKSVIQKGDSFVILSAGFILPESFSLITPVRGTGKVMLPKIKMYFHTEPGHKIYYPQMAASSDGSLFVPFESFEAVFNTFIDVNLGTFYCATDAAYVVGIPQKFTIFLGMDSTQSAVSMINVPDKLNGTTQEVVTFLKIAHNLPMVDA